MSQRIIGTTVGTPISAAKIAHDLKPMVVRSVPFVRDTEHQVFIPDANAIADIINNTDGVIRLEGTVETKPGCEYKVGGILVSHAVGNESAQCTYIGSAIDEEEVGSKPFCCYYTFGEALKTNVFFLADEGEINSINNSLDYMRNKAAEFGNSLKDAQSQIGGASNALIVEKSGDVITLDDVSPIGSVKVSVESRNLVPSVYYSSRNAENFPHSVEISGITFTVNADGSVTLNGKNNGSDNSSFFLVNSKDETFVLKKGTYIGGTGVDGIGLSGRILENEKYMGFSSPYTLEKDTAFQYIYLRVSKGNSREFSGETVYPMLMRGTALEEYVEPLEIGTKVTLTCGEDEIQTTVGEVVKIENVEQGSSIVSDNENVILATEYNRDINIAFAELQQAIISLGGNV